MASKELAMTSIFSVSKRYPGPLTTRYNAQGGARSRSGA